MKTFLNVPLRFAIIICLLTAIGCDSMDPIAETEIAPKVLPEAAFALDVDFFDRADEAGKNTHAFTNFFNAAVRVGVATHVTHHILYYPVTLTQAVQKIEPVQENGSFIWAADTVIAGQKHGVSLTARVDSDVINWQMYVSGVDSSNGLVFEDHLLYEADTDINSQTGSFDVYAPTETGSLHVMNGSYDVSDDQNHTLTFTIPSGVEEIGGASATFQHTAPWYTLDITDPSGGSHFIEWNRETHVGSLTATDYNNGEKSCWNAALMNTECQ